MKMVHYYAISIFLIPITTSLGGDFWNDVDKLYNELTTPQDSPTPVTANEVQQVESALPAPRNSPSPNGADENQLERQGQLVRKYYQKNVTVTGAEVEKLKKKIIIDEWYPQNISSQEIENKLQALGDLHEWYELDIYEVKNYSKYWGKLCVLFWSKPLVKAQRYACVVSPSYSTKTKRKVDTGNRKQYLDLLSCKCYKYEKNYKIKASIPEIFLIHKCSENEYFIFEPNEPPKNNRYNLSIKDFKGGIRLPIPVDQEHNRSSKYVEKKVTLNTLDMHNFYEALRIDNSYPENISLTIVEDRLNKFEDTNEWPNLQKYDVVDYSKYWIKVCVLFGDKQLDISHRQACIISHSYEIYRVRKLFLVDRILHFDLLCCKCHSYVTTYKKPVSATDTFLVHQISENEYIIFEQRATEKSNYTLIIKDFKGGIILPDPDEYNY